MFTIGGLYMFGLGWLYSWRVVPAANQVGSDAYTGSLGFIWALSVPLGALIDDDLLAPLVPSDEDNLLAPLVPPPPAQKRRQIYGGWSCSTNRATDDEKARRGGTAPGLSAAAGGTVA